MGAARTIKRVYIPYKYWECYLNGMWRNERNPTKWIDKAKAFTSNTELYGKAMMEVVKEWPLTMLNSLTNPSVNKLAFIGHCAACYKESLPELYVRLAWKEITEQQRQKANKKATEAYFYWKECLYEKSYSELYKTLGTQMLLRWDTGRCSPRNI